MALKIETDPCVIDDVEVTIKDLHQSELAKDKYG